MTNPRAILWFYPPMHEISLETAHQYSYRPFYDRRGGIHPHRAIGRYTLKMKDPRTKFARACAEFYQRYAFADRLLLYQKQAEPRTQHGSPDRLYLAWRFRGVQARTGAYYRTLLSDFSTDTPFPIRAPTYRLAYESSVASFRAQWSRPPEINETQPDHPRAIVIQSASIGLFSALNDHVRLAPRWWRIIRIDIPHNERYPEPQSWNSYEQERLLFGYRFYQLRLRK